MNYVVYSHSSFADILEVQTDYLKDIDNKFLFIDKSNNLLSNCSTPHMNHLYSQYKDVIYYDDSKPYASRLIDCLEELKQRHNVEFCLFTHDVDIIMHQDTQALENCLQIMKDNKIHRVSLQYDWNDENDDQTLIEIMSQEITKTPKADTVYLRQDAYGAYAYEVNPAIYKIDHFLGLLRVDPNLGYRQIETDRRIQQYAKDVLRACKLKCFETDTIHCGYFNCLPIYIFLHITHSGKLVPTDQDDRFFVKNSYYDVKGEYLKILEKYNLSSNRIFG